MGHKHKRTAAVCNIVQNRIDPGRPFPVGRGLERLVQQQQGVRFHFVQHSRQCRRFLFKSARRRSADQLSFRRGKLGVQPPADTDAAGGGRNGQSALGQQNRTAGCPEEYRLSAVVLPMDQHPRQYGRSSVFLPAGQMHIIGHHPVFGTARQQQQIIQFHNLDAPGIRWRHLRKDRLYTLFLQRMPVPQYPQIEIQFFFQQGESVQKSPQHGRHIPVAFPDPGDGDLQLRFQPHLSQRTADFRQGCGFLLFFRLLFPGEHLQKPALWLFLCRLHPHMGKILQQKSPSPQFLIQRILHIIPEGLVHHPVTAVRKLQKTLVTPPYPVTVLLEYPKRPQTVRISLQHQ